ncbi:hypothetical protein DF222_00155 [Corynebacterium yudongzhengii]|uniref:Uncharacterized protein n=1 Tax=Corynebacterium yudongzhengii TaxID=2080740 RepID=A0A2U1T9K8_9CORY|nr:hypothetical protein DF222_00155 [Corynebacterium yudongzhengii]
MRSKHLPESVLLASACWAAAVGLELLHQILSVIMGFIDPADLQAAARDAGAEEQLPVDAEQAVDLTVTASILLMGLLNVAIVTVLAVMLWLFVKKHRFAGGGRRLLMVFSLFLALRGLLVFAAQPAGTHVPEPLILLDGSLQLIIAVAAVLGLIFANQRETVEYTGELEDTDDDKKQ